MKVNSGINPVIQVIKEPKQQGYHFKELRNWQKFYHSKFQALSIGKTTVVNHAGMEESIPAKLKYHIIKFG